MGRTGAASTAHSVAAAAYCAAPAAASTAARSCRITAPGSAAPKMALPATMTLAPAAAAC